MISQKENPESTDPTTLNDPVKVFDWVLDIKPQWRTVRRLNEVVGLLSVSNEKETSRSKGVETRTSN